MARCCITGDVEQAFLQIKLDAADRDVKRRFWYNDLKEGKMVAYRFTRVIFGSVPSPYILGATLEKHISQYKDEYPETVESLTRNAYVDDVQFDGDCEEDLLRFKKEVTKLLSEGGFHLHEWHSNVTLMEMEACNSDNEPNNRRNNLCKDSRWHKIL